MKIVHTLVAATLLGALARPAPSLAAVDPGRRGIDPISTKLATTIDGFLTVEGARTAPRRSYQLELGLDFASGMMGLSFGDEKVGDLITRRLDLHLRGAYAPTSWMELGVDLPFTAWQGNGWSQLVDLGVTNTSLLERPASSGLGDVRAVGKFRLLSQESAPLALAVLAEVRLPTGVERSFLGESGVMVSPRVVAERTLLSDRLRLGVEGGYRMRPTAGHFSSLYVGDELGITLAGAYRLPERLLESWFAFGELAMLTPARGPFNVDSDALKSPLELLLGVRARIATNLEAQLGAATGLGTESGFGRESFRLFASVRYARAFVDRDGDGVPDDRDRCPDEPEDRDGFQDGDGCPDPDNDGDGLLDTQDKCPDKPGPKENQGCPDSDKDGLPDHLDKCPTKPGPKENEGCPDSDKDGLPDNVDRCPEVEGPREYDGCPDADFDEVPDPDDKCPEKFGPPQNDGCPTGGPQVTLESGKLVLKGTITFDTGKASIKKESWPLLDEAVALLKNHLEVKKLRIEGHTDNVGAANFNRDLSKKRAQSVVDYLITKGIAAARLSAEGYGLERPIAKNDTALGRAKNRRVEFTVME